MKLRSAPALEGFVWMRSGVRLVLSQPLGLAALLGVMVFGLGLLLMLPWVGPLLVSVMLPALSAGWVHTSEQVLAGARPSPSLLLAPLRLPQRKALLQLGGLHALAVMLMLVLADLIDPGLGDMWEMLHAANDDESTASAMQALRGGLVLRLAMLTPVALLFWHAPVLVHREGSGVAKALFASTLASVRNVGAFFVYGLSWLLADLLLSATLGLLLGALGLPQLALMIAVPVAMLFSAAFYASLHASVHGCIDFGDTAVEPLKK
jgi:hypothetical protein